MVNQVLSQKIHFLSRGYSSNATCKEIHKSTLYGRSLLGHCSSVGYLVTSWSCKWYLYVNQNRMEITRYFSRVNLCWRLICILRRYLYLGKPIYTFGLPFTMIVYHLPFGKKNHITKTENDVIDICVSIVPLFFSYSFHR